MDLPELVLLMARNPYPERITVTWRVSPLVMLFWIARRVCGWFAIRMSESRTERISLWLARRCHIEVDEE